MAWQGLLARPIGPDGVQIIDLTYPYANTNNGTLDPHHGVEFPNGFGTPVLAAQAGEVVFAGEDDLTVLGPYTGFYGNVVIVRHAGLFEGRDLFTLYAHLSAIDVTVGQQVALGERVGAVGASGAASGSHLHFEVRLDENDYAHTTNPVLWFSPLNGNGAGEGSILAGAILNRYNVPVELTAFELDRIDKDGAVLQNYYPITYFPSGVNANPILNENFAFPDLPPGDYRLSYISGRYYTYEFSLAAGSLGFIKIQLD
jgi:murein DD-endopeptidase MepM/ murein hydrolase activator NlpD